MLAIALTSVNNLFYMSTVIPPYYFVSDFYAINFEAVLFQEEDLSCAGRSGYLREEMEKTNVSVWGHLVHEIHHKLLLFCETDQKSFAYENCQMYVLQRKKRQVCFRLQIQ